LTSQQIEAGQASKGARQGTKPTIKQQAEYQKKIATMTEPRRGTDADPSSSKGELRKFYKDKKKSKEQPVLGALETFGGLIYKVNTQDQAEMYIRTTKKLTEYVSSIYDKDMRNLVKYATEREFSEPSMPDAKLRSEDRLHEVRYREALSNYNREKQNL
jgi:hypothetical protein